MNPNSRNNSRGVRLHYGEAAKALREWADWHRRGLQEGRDWRLDYPKSVWAYRAVAALEPVAPEVEESVRRAWLVEDAMVAVGQHAYFVGYLRSLVMHVYGDKQLVATFRLIVPGAESPVQLEKLLSNLEARVLRGLTESK